MQREGQVSACAQRQTLSVISHRRCKSNMAKCEYKLNLVFATMLFAV